MFNAEPELLVDNGGVGRAVSDTLRARGLYFKAIQSTSGHQVNHVRDTNEWRVPKKHLVDALYLAFQNKKVKIGEDLKEAPTLRKQLLEFTKKVRERGYVSYEHADTAAEALTKVIGDSRLETVALAYGYLGLELPPLLNR